MTCYTTPIVGLRGYGLSFLFSTAVNGRARFPTKHFKSNAARDPTKKVRAAAWFFPRREGLRKMSRRPTPSDLRRLSGSNLHRLNKREPRYRKVEAIHPPAWLDAVALEELQRIAPELIANRLLTHANVTQLYACCAAYAEVVHAQDHLRENGRRLRKPVFNKAGEQVGVREEPNPAFSEFLKAAVVMWHFAVEFGLAPAAATRVGGNPLT